jgi:hypothetical protein
MAKLKGVRKFNKVMTDIVKPFGISKAKLGEDFAYYFDDEHIEYKVTSCASDDMFADFVKRTFNMDIEDGIAFSLLHEIGHHKTTDLLAEEELDRCYCKVDQLEQKLKNENLTYAQRRKLHNQYFELPNEYLATSWAVAFCKAHPKKYRKMCKKALKAYHEFYKNNSVTED